MLKKRGRSIPIALMLLLSLALVGCGGSKTKVSASEIVQNALTAEAGVTNSSTSLKFDLSWQGTKSGADVQGSVNVQGTLDMDPTNKKMHANGGVTLNMSPIALQPTIDAYAVDNCMYLQVTLNSQAKGWAKQPLDQSFWTQLNASQLEPQVMQFVNPAYLKEEKVNGQDCYVLNLQPNMQQLQAQLTASAGSGGSAPQLDQLIKSMTITAWVAEDTSLLVKIQIHSEMSIPATLMTQLQSDLNIPTELIPGSGISIVPQVDGDLSVTLDATVDFSNYNQAPPIQLPDAAENTTTSFSQYLGVLISSMFSA